MKREDGKIHVYFIFWGPSRSGKTTALEFLYNNVPFTKKGELVKIEDDTGSTMMFDFVPFVVLPEEQSSTGILFHCYTVPGQEAYADRRELILHEVLDADGFIFVADSQTERIKDNMDSFKELTSLTKKILNKELGSDLPFVVFLNKRDLSNAAPAAVLKKIFPGADNFFETVATTGTGIIEGFKKISELVLLRLLNDLSD